jgi:hypothetical protein
MTIYLRQIRDEQSVDSTDGGVIQVAVLANSDTSQHECQWVFQIPFESRHPPGSNSAVNSSMVRTQRCLHDLRGNESSFLLRSGFQHGLCASDCEDAGLWGIYDSSEV